MPLFTFHCTNCGKSFEVLTNAGTIPECPQCGSKEVIREYAGHALCVGNRSGSGCSGSCSTCKGCGK